MQVKTHTQAEKEAAIPPDLAGNLDNGSKSATLVMSFHTCNRKCLARKAGRKNMRWYFFRAVRKLPNISRDRVIVGKIKRVALLGL